MESFAFEVHVRPLSSQTVFLNQSAPTKTQKSNFSETLGSNQAKLNTASSTEATAISFTSNSKQVKAAPTLSVQDTISLLESLNLPLESLNSKLDGKNLLMQEQLRQVKDLTQSLQAPSLATLNLDLKFTQNDETLNSKQSALTTLLALKAQHSKALLSDNSQNLNLKSTEPNLNPLPPSIAEHKSFKLNLKRLKKTPKRKQFKEHWLDFSKQNLEFEDKLCPI